MLGVEASVRSLYQHVHRNAVNQGVADAKSFQVRQFEAARRNMSDAVGSSSRALA